MQHQVDQNVKNILKILNNNSQVESNLQNFNNNLQKSNKKNPLVEVVNENTSKLSKGIKTSQKRKKLKRKKKKFLSMVIQWKRFSRNEYFKRP